MSSYSSDTNNNLITSNYGLNVFVKKTYLCTGGAICSSIGLSKLGALVINTNEELLSDSLPMLYIIGSLMMLGGALTFDLKKYSIDDMVVYVNTMQKKISYSTNSIQRILSYISMIIGSGLVMIPMFIRIPNVVFPAFIASASVFGGATWYAMTSINDELEEWGPTLYGGLSGLIGISLFGLGSYLIFGNNWFGDITHLIDLYGGLILFTGLVAYHTNKSIKKYNSGCPDHLGCSAELYLDFINMFIRFMQIINEINELDKKNSDEKEKK